MMSLATLIRYFPKNYKKPLCMMVKAVFLLLLPSCASNSYLIEPEVFYTPPTGYVSALPSPFPPLLPEEKNQMWGKELWLGLEFSKQEDFYRAITFYKCALLLLPQKEKARRLQIDYEIFLCYYLGQRFGQAVEQFECSSLKDVDATFPALNELLSAACDCYLRVGMKEKADQIRAFLTLLGKEELACSLDILSATLKGNVESVPFSFAYQQTAKSVKTAQFLNAVLPGAGYLYVGQQKTALTSFLLNALFTACAYQCFEKGNIAAGIIVSSFEFGWYFGGINGAGLAAKTYNEKVFNTMAHNYLTKERFFPILLFQKGF